MKKQTLQNEELDHIGLKLLDAARLHSEAIDKIASAPHLFDAVQARIRMEESRHELSGFVGVRIDLPVFHWRKAGIAFAGFAALVIGVWAIFTDSEPNIVQKVQPHVTADDSKANEINVELPNAVEPNEGPGEHRAQVKLAARRTSRSRVPRQRPEVEVPGEFYSLTYAGDPDNAEEDGQIVRVVLPRSAVFAMGVDIPVENEKDQVKTDLLIGSDGITRAVRIVN